MSKWSNSLVQSVRYIKRSPSFIPSLKNRLAPSLCPYKQTPLGPLLTRTVTRLAEEVPANRALWSAVQLRTGRWPALRGDDPTADPEIHGLNNYCNRILPSLSNGRLLSDVANERLAGATSPPRKVTMMMMKLYS